MKPPGKRRLSIRAHITLWNIGIFIFMSALILALAYNGAIKILGKESRDNAARTAFIIAGKVDIEQGRVMLNLSDKETKKLFKGIAYALYSPEGALLDGKIKTWMSRYPKEPGAIRRITHDHDENWFLIDKALTLNNGGAGFLRVAVPAGEYDEDIKELQGVWVLVLLLSIALAVLGGLIAGGALKPLKAITGLAREIGAGDLTKRLALAGKKDEIGELIGAFNEMADSLEQTFAREKQFTSDVSHELRTPLSVITAHAENAEQVDDIETYRRANAAMLQKCRHLQRMISQLLTFAREREQADSMCLEEVDLHRVLADIAEEAAEWAREKSITVEADVPVDMVIHADQMLITRLFLNLLDNAVKYGRNGGWVKIRAEKDSRRALVSVCDNGEGIAEADLPHIFKRFYRADKARSGEGTGLGLSFAEMIVRLHHGKITASSVLGIETRFVVELPLEPSVRV